jgi:hypothetical protein
LKPLQGVAEEKSASRKGSVQGCARLVCTVTRRSAPLTSVVDACAPRRIGSTARGVGLNRAPPRPAIGFDPHRSDLPITTRPLGSEQQ